MPKEVFGRDYAFLPARGAARPSRRSTALARVFVGLGVEKIRLTGGEPLVRRDLERLVGMLAGDRRPRPDADHQRLAPRRRKARALAGRRAAARHRQPRLARRRRLPGDERRRLSGRARARRDRGRRGPPASRRSRSTSSSSAASTRTAIVRLARHFRGTGVILRFIEYMDVGHTNGWRLDDVVPAAEIVGAIDAELPLEPVEPNYRGEVADRWRYRDGSGEIGVIASVTQPFCGDCTRARLSADGQALHLPLRGQGPRPAGASAERRERRGARRGDRRRSGARAPTATRSSAPRRPPTCPRSRCRYIGG